MTELRSNIVCHVFMDTDLQLYWRVD